jgi:hypothetical protein
MKKIVLFVLFFIAVFFAPAQIRKIPAEVTEAFATRYPHATKVEWRDKLHYFEVSFVLNSTSISANFSSRGEWQSSERKLNFDDLSGDVMDGFRKSKYAEWEKKSVYEVQELGKPLQYRINIQKSGIKKKNLYFDVNGRLLRDAIVL